MGLDMYLGRRLYVGNLQYVTPKQKLSIKLNNKPIAGLEIDKVSAIEESLITWRKANAIHQWFVVNIQDGNDDCQKYDVSVSQLRELLKVVTAVIESPGLAKDLLPTQEGFFFGSTDYNDDYFEDLKFTKEELERVIKDKIDGPIPPDFTYQSSW